MEKIKDKISIITICFNCASDLERTIKSVLAQTYRKIEYIIVDGGSTDHTPQILEKYKDCIECIISESDDGIYDALNKGINMATGDYVGLLNSDDFFTADDVIERFVNNFEDPAIDAVYGDIHFIHPGEPNKCVRYYSSKRFHPRWLRFGFMPAHPSFYARKNVLEKAGPYKTDYKIGSDYEMMVRLFRKQQIHAKYLPIDFVTMRTGGLSTRSVQSRIQLIRDDIRACRENGVYTNALFISLKFLYKIFEFKF